MIAVNITTWIRASAPPNNESRNSKGPNKTLFRKPFPSLARNQLPICAPANIAKRKRATVEVIPTQSPLTSLAKKIPKAPPPR